MTTYTATVTKVSSFIPAGKYVATSVDARKASADILLKSSNGRGGFIVDARVALSGRGIKAAQIPGRYTVSEGALTMLRTKYAVECDF